jgi:hypothetical protein
MEKKREVDQGELLAATCLYAPLIPLYPSITSAVYRISAQSAPDRNRDGT